MEMSNTRAEPSGEAEDHGVAVGGDGQRLYYICMPTEHPGAVPREAVPDAHLAVNAS